jgi:radical SAM-linked protein
MTETPTPTPTEPKPAATEPNADEPSADEPSAEARTPKPAPPPEKFRYRLAFAKEGPLRWIGHLDLQTTFSRTLRRAKLPLWFSKGYHPRPKLVFASALPLGCSSSCELCDLWLREELEAEGVLTRLVAAAPPGLRFTAAELIVGRAPAVTTLVQSASYRVTLPPELSADDEAKLALGARVEALLAVESLPRHRRGKDYDLRPLILALELAADAQQLVCELMAREGKNGRIEELLDALELDPATCGKARTALHLESPPEKPIEAPAEPQTEAPAEPQTEAPAESPGLLE